MMMFRNTLYLTESEATAFSFRHDLAPVRKISVAAYNSVLDSTIKSLLAFYKSDSSEYRRNLREIQIIQTPGGGFRYTGAKKEASSNEAQLSLFLPDAGMYPGHLSEGEDDSDLPFADHGNSA